VLMPSSLITDLSYLPNVAINTLKFLA